MARNTRKGAVNRRTIAYLKEHLYCERCLDRYVHIMTQQKVNVFATSTHHIEKIGMGGRPSNDPLHQEDNFSALCAICHIWADWNPKKSIPYLLKIKPNYQGNLQKAQEMSIGWE